MKEFHDSNAIQRNFVCKFPLKEKKLYSYLLKLNVNRNKFHGESKGLSVEFWLAVFVLKFPLNVLFYFRHINI